jgi:hypothetical protein
MSRADRRPEGPPVDLFLRPTENTPRHPAGWMLRREGAMQVKLFRGTLADLTVIETEVNRWLAANPKLISIQRENAVYHDHATGSEAVLVTLWYEPKGSL